MQISFPAALYDLLQAPIRWQLVQTAFELKLFDCLSESRSAEAVAEVRGLNPRRTKLVLDALAAMGIVEKSNGHYSLDGDNAAYLTTDGGKSLRDLLLFMPRLRHGGLSAMTALLQGGADSVLPPLDMAAPDYWQRCVANLRAFHRGLALPRMLEVLESLPEWPVARRFLDLGAGSEVLCQAIAERRPDMSVHLFDLPPSATVIEGHLKSEAVGRIHVIGGDYNKDDLGGPYDVIWGSMTLYYASPDLESLLRRFRNYMTANGVFVSYHEGLSDERTKPQIHVVGRLMPALRGMDLSFEQGQIAGAMMRAGFSHVESRTDGAPFGNMAIDIARCGAQVP
jgi:SAM-dependent methyltransferase